MANNDLNGPLEFFLGQVGSIMFENDVLFDINSLQKSRKWRICNELPSRQLAQVSCQPVSFHLTRQPFMLSSLTHIFFIWCPLELELCMDLPWYLGMLLSVSCDFRSSQSWSNNSTNGGQLLNLIAPTDLNWLIFGSPYICCLNSDWLQILRGCFLILEVHFHQVWWFLWISN